MCNCVMPEMPYCPFCEYGLEYREPWWEDDVVEWICTLQKMTNKQKKVIEKRNEKY